MPASDLQAAHEQQDNEDNQDDAKQANSAVAKSVPISPIGDDAASPQSAEEQQDQDDDQNDSQKQTCRAPRREITPHRRRPRRRQGSEFLETNLTADQQFSLIYINEHSPNLFRAGSCKQFAQMGCTVKPGEFSHVA